MSSRSRLAALVGLVVVIVAAVGVTAYLRGGGPEIPLSEPREPVLPDLVTLPLADFLIGTDDEGAEHLRFSTTIANIGPGPLRIEARRNDGSSDQWSVVQWFDEPDGSTTGALIDGPMAYGGHGHDHWHLRSGAVYRIQPVEGTGSEGEADATKAGFCFFDQVRLDPEIPGSPTTARFPPDACGDQESIQVSMGMSSGWSDPYLWQLADQEVDVTGFPDGDYRLEAVADPDGWLRETDDTNNATWTVIRIGTTPDGLRTVEVLESAPAA